MKIYRQGDVMIRAVAEIPSAAQDVTPKNDRIVLAHGEVTGHAHAIAYGEAREFSLAEAGGIVQRFLEVLGTREPKRYPVVARTPSASGEQILLGTEDGVVAFNSADVIDTGTDATPRSGWAKQVHEEHHAHGVLKGLYQITTQREYRPEANINVAD